MSNEFDIFVVGTMCGMTIGLIIETTIFNLGRPWKAGTGPGISVYWMLPIGTRHVAFS
jgi:hypothetical protein